MIGKLEYKINSKELRDVSERRRMLNNELKKKGNTYYAASNYKKAEEAYSEAINLAPTGALYSNRSVVRLKREDFNGALADALLSVEMEPAWPRAYFRWAEALYSLDQITEAVSACQKGIELCAEGTKPKELAELEELQGQLTLADSIEGDPECAAPLEFFPKKTVRSLIKANVDLLASDIPSVWKLSMDLGKATRYTSVILLDYQGRITSLIQPQKEMSGSNGPAVDAIKAGRQTPIRLSILVSKLNQSNPGQQTFSFEAYDNKGASRLNSLEGMTVPAMTPQQEAVVRVTEILANRAFSLNSFIAAKLKPAK